MELQLVVAQTGHLFYFRTEEPSLTMQELTELVARQHIPATAPNRPHCRIEALIPGKASLGPSEKVPTPTGETGDTNDDQIYLFTDPDFAKYFPAATGAAAATDATTARQVQACKLLILPLMKHWNAVTERHTTLQTLFPEVEEQLHHTLEKLPRTIDALKAVPVVDEDGKTLYDKVEGAEKKLKDYSSAVATAKSDLMKSNTSMEALSARVDAEKRFDPLPSSVEGDKMMRFETLVSAANTRLHSVKKLLRDIESIRQLDKKTKQVLDIVRKGIRQVSMMEGLPDAYEEAHNVARQRLTLRRAIKRVLSTLQREADRVNHVVRDFKAAFGERFPSNIFPGIERPVIIGDPAIDHVAANLDPHEPDTDEDHASELLMRLGLTNANASPQQSSQPEEQSLQALKLQLDESRSDSTAALKRAEETENENACWKARCEEYEQKFAQLQTHSEMLEKKNAELFAETELLRDELRALKTSSTSHSFVSRPLSKSPSRNDLKIEELVDKEFKFKLSEAGELVHTELAGYHLSLDNREPSFKKISDRAAENHDKSIYCRIVAASLDTAAAIRGDSTQYVVCLGSIH